MTEDRRNADIPPHAVMEPRFHQAHQSVPPQSRSPANVPQELLAAVAGKSDTASEQLQQQAAELAEHLQSRQRQLARHEATLNARSADYDDQQRSARLWLRERQGELDSREMELQRRFQALEEQIANRQQAVQAADVLAREREQVKKAEQAVEERRCQLDDLIESVRYQAAWLEAARSSWRQQCQDEQRTLNELREQLLDQRQATEELNTRLRAQLAQNQHDAKKTASLAQRERQLEIEVAKIQEQQASLEEEKQTLAHTQQLWQVRTTQQRQAIAAHWRRRRQDLQRQRESLQNRRQSMDDQDDELHRQQQELDRQRREVAEHQLVVRHAHAVLSRQLPAEEFEHIEQAVRRYVQAQLAATEQKLALRKNELQELAVSLQQQQETLKNRHIRLQTQIALRQRSRDLQSEV